MTHSRAAVYLEGYDPDQIPASARKRLDRHAASCARCSALGRQAGAFRALLARSEPVLPPGFEAALERVRTRTLDATQGAERVSGLRTWIDRFAFRPLAVPVAAAVLLAVVFLVQPLRQGPEHGGTMPPAARGESAAPPAHGFKVVRKGSEVRIEWPQNGHSHRIRKGSDPVTLRASGDRVVRGKVWTDPDHRQTPGSVTFYLVD